MAITCFAVSPVAADGVLAVGDRSGKITLWHCLSDTTRALRQDKCVCSVMHWHARGVNGLAFGVHGRVLYSAGEEGVLVNWQLRSTSRTFLPRLGAALFSVAPSPDARWLAIACASNQVVLVDAAAGRVVRVF